ncbi:MAG TPA: hypothetical protein VN457_00355, partial [Chlamydiales bacterium]|nr:hypothetical protein [Chlamydiales bacterium]
MTTPISSTPAPVPIRRDDELQMRVPKKAETPIYRPYCIVIPLAVQDLAGKAISTAGKYVFHENVTKPVSMLGYLASKAIEEGAKGYASDIDFLVQEQLVEGVFGVAADIAEVATTEALQAAVEHAQLHAKVAQPAASFVGQSVGGWVGGGVGGVLGSLAGPLGTAAGAVAGSALGSAAGSVIGGGVVAAKSEAQQLNVSVTQAHVGAAKSFFDWYTKNVVVPMVAPVREALKAPFQNLAMLGEYGAKYFTEHPGAIKEYLIESGDLIQGRVWKQRYASADRFFSVSSLLEGAPKKVIQERMKALEKPVAPLSLEVLKKMTIEERESLIFLIKDAGKFQGSPKAMKRLIEDFTHTTEKERATLVASYNTLTEKEAAKLVPAQFRNLKIEEKTRLVDRVKNFQFSYEERLKIRNYHKALIEGTGWEKLEAGVVPLIVKRFNTLQPKEQMLILNISAAEVEALTKDEQRALLDYLIVKVAKKQTKEAQTDLEALKKLQAIPTITTGFKKIAHCFKNYLSSREKSMVRKLLSDQVVTAELTKNELHIATQKMEQDLKKKIAVLEKGQDTSNAAEVALSTLDLMQSLAYLKSIELRPETLPVSKESVKEKTIETQVAKQSVKGGVQQA